jgi:hypothetical protein
MALTRICGSKNDLLDRCLDKSVILAPFAGVSTEVSVMSIERDNHLVRKTKDCRIFGNHLVLVSALLIKSDDGTCECS